MTSKIGIIFGINVCLGCCAGILTCQSQRIDPYGHGGHQCRNKEILNVGNTTASNIGVMI